MVLIKPMTIALETWFTLQTETVGKLISELGKSVDSTCSRIRVKKADAIATVFICYRDENGRRNPFGPHAHDEEDSCAEAGQEQCNPEEPVPVWINQSIKKAGVSAGVASRSAATRTWRLKFILPSSSTGVSLK